ncbi:MAG: CHAD domain-containing protein [Nitriliruptoraceae bacterium]
MGGYRIDPGGDVTAEIRRIARDQVRRARTDLDGPDPHVAVHEARRRCKKLRALLRLVRDAAPEPYRTENAAIREAARRLAGLRDAAVVVDAYDALVERHRDHLDPGVAAAIREGLTAARQDAADADLAVALAAFRADLDALDGRIDDWALDAAGFDAVAGGLHRTYRSCRRRLADAHDAGTTEALHEWRKQVKYHRHHLDLLRRIWPRVLDPHRRALDELGNLLGDDHDLAVLHARMAADPDRHGGHAAVEAVVALLGVRRAELQHAAWLLGRRCTTETPEALVGRLRGYWDVAVDARRVITVGARQPAPV